MNILHIGFFCDLSPVLTLVRGGLFAFRPHYSPVLRSEYTECVNIKYNMRSEGYRVAGLLMSLFHVLMRAVFSTRHFLIASNGSNNVIESNPNRLGLSHFVRLSYYPSLTDIKLIARLGCMVTLTLPVNTASKHSVKVACHCCNACDMSYITLLSHIRRLAISFVHVHLVCRSVIQASSHD